VPTTSARCRWPRATAASRCIACDAPATSPDATDRSAGGQQGVEIGPAQRIAIRTLAQRQLRIEGHAGAQAVEADRRAGLQRRFAIAQVVLVGNVATIQLQQDVAGFESGEIGGTTAVAAGDGLAARRARLR